MTGRGSRTRRPDRPRGFTLTELLIAMILLAIAIIGTSSVITGTMSAQSQSSTRGEMASLGASKLEAFRIGIDNGNAAVTASLQVGGSLTSNVSGYNDQATGPNGRVFIRRWLVEEGPALTRRVTMRVLPQSGTYRTPASADLVTNLLVR